ncbi:MAG TPA: GNAT family N-acetyltransferase [Bryobacteraceae bacterium]|nr:GNAT family N-acetyltransferase [Bryobacteraceae bacterium]
MRDYEVINENLRHALAAFSYVREAGHLAQPPGASLVYAGVPFSLFNTALLTAAGNLEELLNRAEEYFRKRSAPWSVWFCDDLMSAEHRRHSRVTLATRGMKMMMDAPGMIAGDLTPPRAGLPPLVCVPVGDEPTRVDFSRVMSEAFHVPEHMAQEVYGGERLWKGTIRGWVGYDGAEAVSTTATVIGGGAIGVYAVATVPGRQRKGYGEALMRHAIGQGQIESGLTCSVLQSSAIGYPLYVRMGYRHVTRFCVYAKG